MSRRRRIPVRWKLLGAFTAAFTAVFAFIAIWVIQYASDVAMNKLTAQLLEATEGAARDLPVSEVRTVTTLTPQDDLQANAAFRRIQDDLLSVRATLPDIDPYSYFDNDGRLEFLITNQTPFRQPVAQAVPPVTVEYMQQGLRETTFQPQYTDAYGTWISAYSPITDQAGRTVAVVAMDYPLTYVTQVQDQARAEVLPILAVSYVLLILLVLVVSSLIVRPLRRLTSASARIADGEYDLDLSDLNRTRFPDEMSELAESFKVMAAKVQQREQALSTQVRRLQVQIDAAQREESVREITETEFFADLAAKAEQMRARMHKQ